MSTTMPNVKPKSFTYRTNVTDVEGRAALLKAEGKPALPVSSPPEFGGSAGIWTPEDMFVAAIEVCLMLTFVGIAAKRDFQFASYESSAEGILEWGPGSYRFTRVIVSPTITVLDEESIDTARQILQRAHDTCLIANSITSAVIVKPTIAMRQ